MLIKYTPYVFMKLFTINDIKEKSLGKLKIV